MLQAVFLFAHRAPVQVHDLGQWASGSGAIAAVVAISQVFYTDDEFTRHDEPVFILRIINIATVLVLTIACLLIPRRPDIFFRDHLVDPHYTITSLSRNTWAWARPYLDLATKQGDLHLNDLPRVEHFNRADWLVKSWNAFGFEGRLLHSLLWAYKYHFAFQWSATLFKAALGMGPFWAILRLIRILEQRSPGDPPDAQLWMLIIFLGLFTLAEQVHLPSTSISFD